MAIARLLLQDGASHVHVVLVDYNASLGRSCSPGISVECHEDLNSADATDCDLVLASGILEHIPHPQPDFTRLLSTLRPGGLFYARTPWSLPCSVSCNAWVCRLILLIPHTCTIWGKAIGRGFSAFSPLSFSITQWSVPSHPSLRLHGEEILSGL